MKTWIALLRGINVGGKHIVPMKELVRLLESNGFINVKTYIQSGNVVFHSPKKPKDEISLLIEKKFDFKPMTLVLSEAELRQALSNNPYPGDVGKAVHFFFCDRTPKNVDYKFLQSLKTASEQYMLADKVFYLYAPDGIGRSKLVEKMGKAFPEVVMTARNLNTVNKLIAMVEESA